MGTREAFRIFMKHQLQFAVEEGIIQDLPEKDMDRVINDWEDDPDFHTRMADFLNDELDNIDW